MNRYVVAILSCLALFSQVRGQEKLSDLAPVSNNSEGPTMGSMGSTGDSGIYIKVGEAQIKRSLIALASIQMATSQTAAPQFQTYISTLQKVIKNDLDMSGFFDFLEPKAFLEDVTKVAPLPLTEAPNGFKYESWKTLGVEFLVRSSMSVVDKQVILEVHVYHVNKQIRIMTEKFKGTPDQLPKIAHRFSNALVKALTGKEGMFLSKIVVSSSKKGTKFKEIYIMDWDGGNPNKVTSHNSISLSPNWSPDGSKIIYTSFVKKGPKTFRNPDLFLLELDTQKRWLLSSRMGLNSGGFFHPDGKSILMTMTQAGNADIVRIDTDGNILKKVTNGPSGAVNVEPAVSPDGSKIAFSSDRSGRPMIWTMDIDGGNLTRRTFTRVYNSSPSWSPDGSKIAFASLDDRHYDIFIMNSDGTGMERLTSAKKTNGKWSTNEDPVFSPDGRHIMFTSDRTGHNQIFIINVDGSNEHRITFDENNYYKPRWSKNFD